MVFQVIHDWLINSHELVNFIFFIQPVWASSIHDLPLGPPDVYEDFPRFVQHIADWIETRAASKRMVWAGLACEVIRKANTVWGGIGVYTVCELFYDAGKSFISIVIPMFNNISTFSRTFPISYRTRGFWLSIKDCKTLWGILAICPPISSKTTVCVVLVLCSIWFFWSLTLLSFVM